VNDWKRCRQWSRCVASWQVMACRGMSWHDAACSGMSWPVMACCGMWWHVVACRGMWWRGVAWRVVQAHRLENLEEKEGRTWCGDPPSPYAPPALAPRARVCPAHAHTRTMLPRTDIKSFIPPRYLQTTIWRIRYTYNTFDTTYDDLQEAGRSWMRVAEDRAR
jgi:hypothetical protein